MTDLQSIFKFNQADLTANRGGSPTGQQLLRLVLALSFPIGIYLALFIGTVFIFFYAGLADRSDLIPLFCFGIVAAVFLLFALHSIALLVLDILVGSILVTQGHFTLTDQGQTVYINNRSFRITGRQSKRLERYPGQAFRFYYFRFSRKIVSAEPA